MNRKKSRELAMKLLFQMTINKQDFDDTIEAVEESSSLKDIDMDYLKRVVQGIEKNKNILDERIQKYLKNWKLNRISKIDITILRICCYEFLYEEDIPKNVSINEAVELGKIYGEDKSASFINGVLGNMIKDINKE
ncbi:transcription antitermination factor NusB [Clostridium tyrobutyricum]|uniref:transcription antitermination factor NusB n=1 Tax=Clostridium tyrobutyricum TaxID=1519 RepID=UPI001C386733|nr:transcription antitermination factor NusB [Clostridium tyrobutyricum]MBV4418636.1 transcription antitermination factor NusB [Clostridium tyrobutyricum]